MRTADELGSSRTASHVEWPTVGVAATIAAGTIVVLATHQRLGAPLTVVLLGVLGAWYGSLRHEVVHGHPTPWRWVNTVVAAVPLSLTEPFWHYREDHLRHHATDELTDPLSDPESSYLCRSAWAAANAVTRAARIANTTLAGRLIIGPWFAAASVVRDLRQSWVDGRRRWAIVRFVLADLGVLVVVSATGLPLWQWVLGVGYLGTSLTLVRSYAEHRAVPEGSRTAVVLGRGFWAVLFLNNNLHVTHHRNPGLAWYRIPAAHAASDADRLAADGAGLYRGYGEIFRRYLVRPLSDVVDPLDREPHTARA